MKSLCFGNHSYLEKVNYAESNFHKILSLFLTRISQALLLGAREMAKNGFKMTAAFPSVQLGS